MAERYIQPTREPMQPRAATTQEQPSTFERAQQRTMDRQVGVASSQPVTQPDTTWAANLRIQNSGQTAIYGQPDLSLSTGVTPNGNTQKPLYDINNPLGLTADLFSRFFANTPSESPQAPVLVGDTSTSTGSSGNAGLFFVLILLGVGGYFIYRRLNK